MVKNKCLYPVKVPKSGIEIPIFRCGKCPHCLEQRAKEFAVRVYRESQCSQICFMTLTYRDDACPINKYEFVIDKFTGEVVSEKYNIYRDPYFFERAPFHWKMNKNCHRIKRFSPLIEEFDIQIDTQYKSVEYFTINIDDVQKWLKRFRKRFDDCLPKFKYVVVPEYGSVGYRPHYHIIFCGLSKKYIHSLAIEWNNLFGHCDIEWLSESSNPSESARKVGIYVGKYCTKGQFDCPYIGEYCKKPRRCSSIDFGCGDEELFARLQEYLLVYEVFRVHSPKQFEVSSLSEKEIRLLASRRIYKIDNGFYMPMPQYLIKKVFYEKCKVTTEKIQDSFQRKVIFQTRATELQKKISSFVLDKYVSDLVRQQEESKRTWDFDSGYFGNTFCESISEKIAKDVARSNFISGIERNSIF